MAASDRALVTFRDGFTVAKEVFALALDLESRGLDVRVRDGGRLQVLPAVQITCADAVAIRTHKVELIALCRYVEMKLREGEYVGQIDGR